MADAFWERKMKTYFTRIDFDGDGNITKADFQGMGDRFVSAEALKGDAATAVKAKLIDVSVPIIVIFSFYLNKQTNKQKGYAKLDKTEICSFIF